MSVDNSLINEYENLQEQKENDWDKPIYFDEYDLPDFPIEAFPDWLSDYIKGVAESTQTPIDASGIAAISILSTSLAKKFKVYLTGEWTESLNTYSILALPSGNRKSSVFKAFQKPVTNFEKEKREELFPKITEQNAGIRAKRKRLEQLEKNYAKEANNEVLNEIISLSDVIENEKIITLPRFITEDVTTEKLADLMSHNNEKMSLLSAEGAGIFSIMAGRYSSDGKANIELYLKAYSEDYCSIDRIGRATNTLNEPNLTIGLFIQPSVIKKVPHAFQERGLMPRFIYSFPKSPLGYRKVSPETVKLKVKECFNLNIKKLLTIEPETTIALKLSSSAISEEQKIRSDIETMFLEGGKLSDMKEWGSKLSGQIIRIAGLIHISENIESVNLDMVNEEKLPIQIEKSTFLKATYFLDYFIEHAKLAYGQMGMDENIQDSQYLLQVIKRQDKSIVPYRDIQNLTRKKFEKAARLQEVLDELEERNFISQFRKGRKRMLEINPYILEG